MKAIRWGWLIVCVVYSSFVWAKEPAFSLRAEQVTSGDKHHFFGYIGQCQTIPWNASGRYILGMEIDRIDRMPEPDEAATIILIDTQNENQILRIEKTHAWNPQQGTMFYWNPLAPETQFFFNDRDVESGTVFTVLYDIEKRRRVREYRFEDTPIGNGGVAADGSAWLGMNYGRLARLRLVTGYPGALDWSAADPAPENDGMFIVDVKTGKKRLLVSYRQLEELIKKEKPNLKHTGLFINHTLWNRDCDRIYFIVRAGWNGKDSIPEGEKRLNVPCSIHADGTGLTTQKFIGGHPEWAEGPLLIGREGKNQIVYDVDQKKVVEQWGTRKVFPNPEGDISLSPNGDWFANGYKKGDKNFYTVYRRSDGAHAFSEGIYKGNSSGNIRIDPAPRWNRTNDAILVPGLAKNGTRQMFLLRVISDHNPSPETEPWSVRTVQSLIRSNPSAAGIDFREKVRWHYATGLVLSAMLKEWEQTKDASVLAYVESYYDALIEDDGTIRTYNSTSYNIDHINPGKALFPLYKKTGKEKYRNAIQTLRNQMKDHPRTRDGGFWHKQKYTHQMWLDGLYMGSPFLAQYAQVFDEPALLDDVANQLLLMERVARDEKTGLLYHGWDESREQRWADPETGLSPHFWGRAMGWYAMALVDALDYFPEDHASVDEIKAVMNRLFKALAAFQDEESGLWYQVVDQGVREGNYLEASCSSMFVYSMAKAVRLGYIDKSFLTPARKGYQGILDRFIVVEDDGSIILTRCCRVAGLGGNPYRDGSYAYYVGEPVRDNDPKGVGPFILASLEIEGVEK